MIILICDIYRDNIFLILFVWEMYVFQLRSNYIEFFRFLSNAMINILGKERKKIIQKLRAMF